MMAGMQLFAYRQQTTTNRDLLCDNLPSAYSLKLTQCRSLIYDKYRGKAQAGKGFAAVGVSGL
jgi:hypothetical protein